MDKSDANIAQRLKEFREEYIAVIEINRSYERMFIQLKDFYTKVKNNVYNYTQNVTKQKAVLMKTLEDERLNFQNEIKLLSDQINNLSVEHSKCLERDENMNKIIQEQNIKISELEEEVHFLKLQHTQKEENIKKILTKNQEVQVSIEYNDDPVIIRKEYLERLKFLENVHKEQSEKQEQEIMKLQSMLKQNKLKVSTKNKRSTAVGFRYPDLSEFIEKTTTSTEIVKKRKLHLVDDDNVVDV